MGSVSKLPAVRSSEPSVAVDLAAPALQLKRVTVCTDFSEVSAPAVDEAYRLCLRHHAALSILFVLEHDDLSEWPDAEKELALLGLQRRHELDLMAARLATPSVVVRPIFLDGNASTVLLQAIQGESPDLVVVGTHGRRGIDRLLLGSTAEAIVRSAECPVMTVGPGALRAHDHAAGPIVCATDFHDGAEESVAYAAFLSEQHQVPLHCIHVLPMSSIATKNHIVATIMETALVDLQMSSGKNAFQPSSRAVFGREVSRAVVEYAREVHASAIVLSVTRRTSLSSHLPLRRTSRMLILANCPVFTLSHEKHVSPLLRSTVM
ncbi:universal stress protein [Terriglobus roseus]|uniref:Nucleotide-binding universal stress protein, UspA family n=1 Tax=Terriglobus roseus TaxID=392734 RepID=A0A1H4J8F3_9BACT|nr:universal stress protein [Terriglobus roseus]SEB42345.1 Nucleotide-binding universal stress protein, UspA family [Terriglobus roseus]